MTAKKSTVEDSMEKSTAKVRPFTLDVGGDIVTVSYEGEMVSVDCNELSDEVKARLVLTGLQRAIKSAGLSRTADDATAWERVKATVEAVNAGTYKPGKKPQSKTGMSREHKEAAYANALVKARNQFIEEGHDLPAYTLEEAFAKLKGEHPDLPFDLTTKEGKAKRTRLLNQLRPFLPPAMRSTGVL